MIDYKCPKCGEALSSPESMEGLTETCPSCGRLVAIPVPEDETLAAITTAVQESIPPDLPPPARKVTKAIMRTEHPTTTESVIRWIGLLSLAIGVIVVCLGIWSSRGNGRGWWIVCLLGVGMCSSALPYLAISHVLRYLRRIASATEAGI